MDSFCQGKNVVGFNGLTLPGVGFGRAQVSPFLPAFGIQPDLGLPAQLVPLNPQLAGPFLHHVPSVLLPAQGNQLPPGVFPPSQQEQPVSPQDPSMPSRQQIPNQVVPQYYPSIPFPQRPGGQWFSYYFPYGSPQRSPTVAQQQLNQGQQNLEQITQTPILLLQVQTHLAGAVSAGGEIPAKRTVSQRPLAGAETPWERRR
ncbi:calcium-binding protein P-like [Arapaima gigas]